MSLALDRREGAGIGVAVIGHVVLFGLLSVGFLATPNPLKLETTPIEVSLTDEVGLVSEAPVIEREAPAERLAEVPAPPEPDSPPPVPETQAEPVTRPDPTPPKAAPAPAPKPQPKAEAKKSNPAPAKAERKTERQAVKPTGRLSGIVDGLTDQPSKGKATRPQASQIGANVKASLQAEILRQVRPHWAPPSGADSEKLKTQVIVRLNERGEIVGSPTVKQSGFTPSNRAQAKLHAERAVRAVQLAAPFKLPTEFYEAWKTIGPVLYEGL
ncbi:TonB C-terminal domain-containing protein [Sphingomonas suaedae]|uniref:TonB C-terminal domain-containing protein n=1 Tax=Sphingomonas suaedae TaxID=2599297 RepID=A0A518RG07_9SPHN|nr:TonB C-terminal domain-containing protein [Sphingomonas suaedae]QDX26388.1 TonB C-terminal domain-containing protein [Sphingomonas suaedae]